MMPLPSEEGVVVGAAVVAAVVVGAAVVVVVVTASVVVVGAFVLAELPGGEQVLMSVSWASSQDLKCATSE